MRRDVIVLGATTGSVQDVARLLRGLPPDLPAAVLAVIHIPADHPSILPELSDPSMRLDVFCPKDRERITRGRVYLASPNAHLVIEGDRVRIHRSAQENLHRPSVDPLFRSAAYYYGPRVAGVILSKTDSDGTSGLYAIKLRHGVTILRDPAEGHLPVMPWSVDHVRIDYQLSLDQIPKLLVGLAEGKHRVRIGGGRSHAQ